MIGRATSIEAATDHRRRAQSKARNRSNSSLLTSRRPCGLMTRGRWRSIAYRPFPPTRRYLKLLLRKVTPAGAEPIELWKPAVPDPVEVMLAKVIAVPPSNRTA